VTLARFDPKRYVRFSTANSMAQLQEAVAHCLCSCWPERHRGSMAFELPIRVYWEDTDAGGIVFYANYLKFFERARTEWLRSLGVGQQVQFAGTNRRHVCRNRRAVALPAPARLDDQLIVTASLQDKGRASLTIGQQALLKPEHMTEDQPRLLTEATIRIGWVDAATPCARPASRAPFWNNFA
jgi:acyl-CoA thioester hydrolase